MMKNKRFDDILDKCLDRLLTKSQTVEQCLADYPEEADELEPLLNMAVATERITTIQPSPEFRTRARYQFRLALQDMKTRESRSFFGRLPQWATAVAAVLVFMLITGSGTVAAAGNSMPDEALYPVKLATEQVQLTLTPSDMGKAECYAKLADRRVTEIASMADKGKPELVNQAAWRLSNCLAMVATLASVQGNGEEKVMLAPAPRSPAVETVPEEPALDVPGKSGTGGHGNVNNRAKLRETVGHYAADHTAALRAVLKKAPESAKPALLKAIAISEAGYQKALRALD